MSQWELPEGSPYTNWAGWSALLLGLIDNAMYYPPNWVEADREAFPEQLGTLKYILPLLAQCAAALEVVPVQFFVLAHTEAQSTSGGSTTSDNYNKHNLNTEILDPDNNVALSSGDAIVEPGTWLFIGLAMGYKCSYAHAALYSVSDAARLARGLSDYLDVSGNAGAQCMVVHPMVLSVAKTLRLELYSWGAQATNGLGAANSKGTETYAYLIGLKMA